MWFNTFNGHIKQVFYHILQTGKQKQTGMAEAPILDHHQLPRFPSHARTTYHIYFPLHLCFPLTEATFWGFPQMQAMSQQYKR